MGGRFGCSQTLRFSEWSRTCCWRLRVVRTDRVDRQAVSRRAGSTRWPDAVDRPRRSKCSRVRGGVIAHWNSRVVFADSSEPANASDHHVNHLFFRRVGGRVPKKTGRAGPSFLDLWCRGGGPPSRQNTHSNAKTWRTQWVALRITIVHQQAGRWPSTGPTASTTVLPDLGTARC